MTLRLVADTHVHFYPCFEPVAFCEAAFENFARISPEATAQLLCLTETPGRTAFADLSSNSSNWLKGKFRVEKLTEPGSLSITRVDGRRVFVFAGCQIVSAERLEVSALCTLSRYQAGLPLAELLAQIRGDGGVPVINWAPGKLSLSRGRLVAAMLVKSKPGDFLFCDTALRPRGTALHPLLRQASAAGFGILGGSDPFPFRDEEKRVGSYGVAWDGEFDSGRPVASFLALLGQAKGRLVGRRLSVFQTASRICRLIARKKASQSCIWPAGNY